MSKPDKNLKRANALGVIRTAMVEKKLTQQELADAADCHEKTIQNLMQGRTVRDQTLFDVCMVLDLDYQRIKDDWAGSMTAWSLPSTWAPTRAPASTITSEAI